MVLRILVLHFLLVEFHLMNSKCLGLVILQTLQLCCLTILILDYKLKLYVHSLELLLMAQGGGAKSPYLELHLVDMALLEVLIKSLVEVASFSFDPLVDLLALPLFWGSLKVPLCPWHADALASGSSSSFGLNEA